ncbi:MAG: SDR family NAD(P)-dependent oxidoreductase [Alphaproteobacteria bacterium]|nr:SDR family NAD(P)-dependent oxidoreductase [Alphaproteobacteria bacterium]
MTILVTGAAGFIGMHVAAALLERGETVIGLDNLNDYYDPTLKQARVERLQERAGFRFVRADIASAEAVSGIFRSNPAIDRVVHLAAQAGVRYSLTNPEAYIQTNLVGHFNMLEACRHHRGLRHLVYASSSSVYGGNTKLPFAVEDHVDQPVSLYAATKAADELMSHCYSHLYGFPSTGLRFFTVYGPWGRPDMSAFIFTRAILRGEPITVFNRGDMRRDFTYVDDIVAGVVAALDRPPSASGGATPHRRYNLGNNHAEPLLRFIEAIERATNHKAIIELAEMQPGDVKETYADIETARRDIGFVPRTSIDEGIPRFVAWFRQYHGL